jgi:5,5'-dehydrodivanillate O-demethylase
MALSSEDNIRLTQTGKGTPMGELLRRYWHPIGAATEFDDKSTKQVRLLGEDLVLYKDRSGTYGLLALHCPHRRADLSYGFVEECGLRCSYHGWAFDEQGNCLSAPFEDTAAGNTRFRDQIHQTAYPVEERGGMLFAYLGPEPVPCCPTWEPFTWDNGFVQIVFSDVACNWLQCAENNIDPVHFEWLHGNWSMAQLGDPAPAAARHLQISYDEWEFGMRYNRILENPDKEKEQWQGGPLSLFPNVFVPGHFEYRVPVDDTNTLSVVWHYTRVPTEQQPYHQGPIPHWYAPIVDSVTGRWITSHVINQDTVAWVGQGALTDRENEHLGRSDVGVVALRRALEVGLEDIAAGRDPKAVIRDPEVAKCIRWPWERGKIATQNRTLEQMRTQAAQFQQQRFGRDIGRPRDYFGFLAGQPEDIKKAYEVAMGL